MNKNKALKALFVLIALYAIPSFAANISEISAIKKIMTAKTTTSAQMIDPFKKLAANGEAQLIELYLMPFVDKLKAEAAAGVISQQQVDTIRKNGIAAVRNIKGKLREGTTLANKIADKTYDIQSTQSQPVKPVQPIEPTQPVITPSILTQQEMANYINALISLLYTDSDFSLLSKTDPKDPNAAAILDPIAKKIKNFAAAIQRVSVPTPTPGAVLDQINDYRVRLLDILRNLAAKNISAVNTQINNFPDPVPTQLMYIPVTTAISYDDYLNTPYTVYALVGGNNITKTYAASLQELVRNSNLFTTVTKAQADTTIQTATDSREALKAAMTVTAQNYNDYINALVRRMYMESDLSWAFDPRADENARTTWTNAAKRFTAALQRAYNPPTIAGAALDQANDYRARLVQLLTHLAANDMGTVVVDIYNLPEPIIDNQSYYSPIVNPITYTMYLNSDYYMATKKTGVKYQTMMQTIARDANLFSNLTRAEINAIEASIPQSPAGGPMVTQQDLNSYVDALVKKLYRESFLRARGTGLPDPAADKQSVNFATAIRCYDPNVLPAQSSTYKQILLDIMKSLAVNDIATVNIKLAQLPDPATPLSNLGTYFTSLNYFNLDPGYQGMKYTDMLHGLVTESNIFSNVTKSEIDAQVAAMTP